VSRIAVLAFSATIALAGALPSLAASNQPAVVRPSFELGGLTSTGGTAFFIRVDGAPGFAAVGTAHGFDLELLTQAEHVSFDLGHSVQRAATSSGLLVPPGRSFFAPGSSLREDFNVYALDAAPQHVRVLELSSRTDLTLGMRVRFLGIPQSASADETEVFGRIAELSRTHIEVDLEIPFDLRGWGGAPALDAESGQVIGILEASSPQGDVARVSLAPVGGVRAALEKPLAGGAGRPFASFAGEVSQRVATPRQKPQKQSPSARAPRPVHKGPLLVQGPKDAATRVRLEIDFPHDGARIKDSICGAFVSGRALAHHGELRKFDVVIVIDTSQSTSDPTGADINGNGVVGRPRLGSLGSIFTVGSTDPGDSILAAEVAAARQLLRGLDPRSTRVGVVRFAGDPPGSGGGIFGREPRRPAITLEPLTNDYARIELALNNVLLDEPAGSTHIAAGVDQATIELTGLPGALSEKDPESEKVVFFFTDGQPTLPYPNFEADNVRAVLRAADRANKMKIRIHSFAIGPEALDGPMATIEMASRTNGYFTPIRHPGDLVDVVEEVSFANLSEVRVHNVTTGADADPFRTTADGTWGGFIKLQPGANQIEISARAEDGASAKTSLALNFEPDAPDAAIPRDLVVQRNRLLEDCLINLKRVRMKAEEERNEAIRQELKMEIERERLKARERAAEQRKQLQIDIEKEDDVESER